MAGFQAARGDVIFTLDGDLQDDPAEIPRFLAELEQGFDVISGWKKTRHDPWHKVYPSRVFNWMVSRLTGCHLHDHNCGFKLYRKAVLDEIGIYGELHRFIPVLAHARGFRVGEVVVQPPAPAAWDVEIRRLAPGQGVPRPAHRPLPDPLQPATTPRPGRLRPGAAGARRHGDALPGDPLARPEATGRSAIGPSCFTREPWSSSASSF